MYKWLIINLLLTLPAIGLTSQESQQLGDYQATPLYQMSHADIDNYLQLLDKDNSLSVADRIDMFASQAEGTPIKFMMDKDGNKNGLGSCADNMKYLTHVTLVNRSIALAISKNWRDYFCASTRIWHEDGIFHQSKHISFIPKQWPENMSWLLEDVSSVHWWPDETVSAKYQYHPKELIQRLLNRKWIDDSPDNHPEIAEVEFNVVKRSSSNKTLDQFKSGDILFITETKNPNSVKVHMGVVVVRNEIPYVLTAFGFGDTKIVSKPLSKITGPGQVTISGMRVFRVKENIDMSNVRSELQKVENRYGTIIPDAAKADAVIAKRPDHISGWFGVDGYNDPLWRQLNKRLTPLTAEEEEIVTIVTDGSKTIFDYFGIYWMDVSKLNANSELVNKHHFSGEDFVIPAGETVYAPRHMVN